MISSVYSVNNDIMLGKIRTFIIKISDNENDSLQNMNKNSIFMVKCVM